MLTVNASLRLVWTHCDRPIEDGCLTGHNLTFQVVYPLIVNRALSCRTWHLSYLYGEFARYREKFAF